MSWFQKLRFLYHFDILAPSIEFTNKGKSRSTSIMGVLFTLCIVIVSILSAKKLISQIVYTKDPTVSFDYQTTNEDYKLDFNKYRNNFLFQFLYVDGSLTRQPINSDYFKITLIKQSNSNKQYVNITDSNVSIYFLEKCNEDFLKNNYLLKGKGNYTNDELKTLKDTALCLPEITDSEISFYEDTTIDLAISNTPELQNLFSILIFKVIYKEYIIDRNNYDSPYKVIWDEKYFAVNSDKLQAYNFNLMNYYIDVYNPSFIFQIKRDTLDFGVIDYISDYIDTVIPEIFLDVLHVPNLLISFIPTYQDKIIEIKYTTYDELLSTLGGTFAVITFIFQYIHEYLYDCIFKAEIINSVFMFHSNDYDYISNNKINNKEREKGRINSKNEKDKESTDSNNRFIDNESKLKSLNEIENYQNIQNNLNYQNNFHSKYDSNVFLKSSDKLQFKSKIMEQIIYNNKRVDKYNINSKYLEQSEHSENINNNEITKSDNKENNIIYNKNKDSYDNNDSKSFDLNSENRMNDKRNCNAINHEINEKNKLVVVEEDKTLDCNDNMKNYNDNNEDINLRNKNNKDTKLEMVEYTTNININNDLNKNSGDNNTMYSNQISNINKNTLINNMNRDFPVKNNEGIIQLDEIRNCRRYEYVTIKESIKILGCFSIFNDEKNIKHNLVTKALSVIENKLNYENYFKLFYEIELLKKIVLFMSVNKSSPNKGRVETQRLVSHLNSFISPPSYSQDCLHSCDKIIDDFNNNEIVNDYWNLALLNKDALDYFLSNKSENKENKDNNQSNAIENINNEDCQIKELFLSNIIDSIL